MRYALIVVMLAACGGEAAKRPTLPPDTTRVVAPAETLPAADTGANTSAVDSVITDSVQQDTVISSVVPEAAAKTVAPGVAVSLLGRRGAGFWNLPPDSTCGPTYSATQWGGSRDMRPALEKVARCKGWVVISVGRKVSLDRNGLSAKAACSNIATWPDLTPFRANVLAVVVADDINNDFNGTGAPRYATIDSIANCVHDKGSWIPTYVRQKASGLKPSYTWRWLDGAWAQYGGPLHGDGTPAQYVAREEAAAQARGLGLILGLNGLDSGDGSSRIMGTYPAKDNHWQMTVAEFERAGTLFIKHSCVVLSWTWPPGFNYIRPASQLAGIKSFSPRAAFAKIRATAPPATSCPLRGKTLDPGLDSVRGSGVSPTRTIELPSPGDLYHLTGGLTRTAYFPVAPDSNVLLKVKVYGIKNFRSIDTLQYTYYRNDSLQVTRRSGSSVDSTQVGAPAYGVTAKYKACAQILVGGTTRRVPPSPMCWTTPWTYTRPAVDASMDSVVKIAVRGHALVPGGPWATKMGHSPGDSTRVLYCAFALLKDGRKMKTTQIDTIAKMHPELTLIYQEEYQRWLGETNN